MPETRFVKFEEYNDHEGETWYFFLPLEGNGARLVELQALVLEVYPEGSDQWMKLDLTETYTESDVDILVKHSPRGYLPVFNKVTGTLKEVVRNDIIDTYGEDGETWLELDGLYKGRVESLFESND